MQILLRLLFVALPLLASCAGPRQISRNVDADEVPITSPPDRVNRAEELVFYALAFLDVKYRYGGTEPDTGWDCSGFVSHVFKNAIGVTLPRTSAAMSERGQSIGRAELQPGDLVFFNTLKRAYSHVGIYIGENRFVHAPSRGKSVQISVIDARYWAQRFDGGRRIVTQILSSK
jgi:cell wall-associated NlpC family hydrolase